VDYNVPGGTDKEGWQYAADFPTYETAVSKEKNLNITKKVAPNFVFDLPLSYRTFHGHKTMKDFVRRRRWMR